MSDTKIVEIKNFEETINEIEYALQDAKDLIKEFSNNKDFRENLDGLKDFNLKMAELKELIQNIYKVQESVGNSANSTATNLAQANQVMENIIITINKFNNNLIKKDTYLEQKIINIYNNAIKKVKNYLNEDLYKLDSELKMINETLKHDYELNYMRDIISIKKTQTTIMWFLFFFYYKCRYVYVQDKQKNGRDKIHNICKL
jgi:hypothetical protein